MESEMALGPWTVAGGQGNGTITRPCKTRAEAEDWARKLIAAGIVPAKINGEPFAPTPAGEGKDLSEVS